jgi:hypothetical protein
MKVNKSLSKTNSAKHSKLNVSTETEMLKDNLSEFYQNSKEKLLSLKAEIDLCKKENEAQKEENNALGMKYTMLIQYNEELNLKLKGMKEKLIAANKNKNTLVLQIRYLRQEVESTGREIDTMKIDTNYKVRMIQNEIDHINNVKENNVKMIHKKIEGEQNYQLDLIRKIEEMKNEIEKYKDMMREVGSDDVRNKELLKETAEMTKFLSEL